MRIPAGLLAASSRVLVKIALCLAVLFVSVSEMNAQSQSEDIQTQIKAEFIERFAHYIEWPEEAFETKTAAFTVCIEGDEPMAPLLQRVLENGRIKERPTLLVSLKEGESPTGCQILYIGHREKDRVEAIVQWIGRAPVLTIGDSLGNAENLVHINLFPEGSHVRFAINAASAKEKGLIVSSKLLVLARPAKGDH